MASVILTRNHGVDEEGLEYIPDQPDFIDGEPVETDHPLTNDIHTGELPSEQDPCDKIEIDDNYGGGCDGLETMVDVVNPNDMTDLIEGKITSARREAIEWNPFKHYSEIDTSPRQPGEEPAVRFRQKPSAWDRFRNRPKGKKKNQSWKQVVDPATGKPMYGNEADAAFGYNVFDDPNVQRYLMDRGMTQGEINNFGDIRQHQLDEAKQRSYLGQEEVWHGVRETPQYGWGQGTGITYHVKRPINLTGLKDHPSIKSPEAHEYVRDVLVPTLMEGKTIPGIRPEITKWYSDQLKSKKQKAPNKTPRQTPISTKGVSPEVVQAWEKEMSKPRRQPKSKAQTSPVGGEWPPGGASKWYGAQQATASKSIRGMRNHANLVGGLLAMPRTAAVIRQTADLVSAVRELDDGQDLDETTRRALRNVSRDLLTATDHLQRVNNRIANRVAGELEQLYVDALSN